MKDFLLTEDNELTIQSGDLLVAESEYQHIKDILEAAPGHYKQYPLLGANIRNFQNGPMSITQKRNIRLHLESDGYKNIKINLKNNEIEIHANR